MRIERYVVALAATGLLASGCSEPHAAGGPKAPQPVKTHVVAATQLDSAVRYSASIEAFEQVPLAFKAAGYVEELLRRPGADGRTRAAQPGDRVSRGTVLARVRESDYRERVSQGRARLAEAEAALVKSRLDLERARTLFAADSLTKPELDSAQAAHDAAEARIKGAAADIELALIALRDCTLVSPAAGVVLERRVEVGALAAAGTVAFVLGDLSSVKARFGIPDAMVQSVRLGDPIDVTVEALAATTFAGRITAVAPTADAQSRVFDVEVTIRNDEGRLRPGMIGTVELGTAAGDRQTASAPVLTVPLTAVVRSDAAAGQFGVLVVERDDAGDVARLRRVELGDVTGNAIAVGKGVDPGDRVVVSGATLLVDGERVQVVP